MKREQVVGISAPAQVGTKIYTHDKGSWQEDGGWVQLLDEAWDVTVARDAAYQALAKVGAFGGRLPVHGVVLVAVPQVLGWGPCPRACPR